MFQFLNLKWRVKHLSEIDLPCTFITDEEASKSLIYQSFDDNIFENIPKTTKKNPDKYIPGKNIYLKNIKKLSRLNKSQHEHCLKALKLLNSGKDPTTYTQNDKYSLQVYSKSQTIIQTENRIFQQFAEKSWLTTKKKVNNISPAMLEYSTHCWKQKLERHKDYPQFYDLVKSISWIWNENEGNPVNFQCTNNVLELGSLARFTPPSLKVQCLLKMSTLPTLESIEYPHFKKPISQDENVVNILQNHKIDVVITSSGLKCLMDNSDHKRKWTIPVVIKEITIEGNLKKKIVFIDKCLAKTNPTHQDLKYYTYKQLLSANFCQYEAFKFNESETEEAEQIHWNASYKIWKITRTQPDNYLLKQKSKFCDINLLVRNKLYACEKNEQDVLEPVLLQPKLGLQLEYGANLPTKSDLSNEWTALFFHPFAHLYRTHILAIKPEVIMLEKCSLHQINKIAQTVHDFKPHLNLNVLQQILQELLDMDVGNYLLHHEPKNGAFISLMKSCAFKENCHDLYDCKFEIDTNLPGWSVLDCNLILPVHEYLDQMPGMFTPCQPGDWKKKKKKKGKVNKTKKTTNIKIK